METSTPLRPPNRDSRRVGFSASKRIESSTLRNGTSPALNLLNDSCDQLERAERRKSAAFIRSIGALPSPALNDSIRGLSDDDLKSQLQMFCKLHAENKISAKNVWSLRVIEVLKQVVSKNNPDVLKVAGNSLEIAGKVYGLRVDDLHSEGLKLAGSLARNLASNKENDEEIDENCNANDTGTEGQRKKRQPKRKRFLLSGDKKHTVVDDPEAFLGPLPKLESASFSARTDTSLSGTDNLFTNRVKMDPSGCKFMFMSKEKAWGWDPGNDATVKMETNEKFPVSLKPVKQFKTCAPFKDFRVDMWDPDQENEDLLRKSNALEDVVFDDNGIPIPELDGSVNDVFQERDNEDFNDNDHMVEEEVVAPLIREEVEHIVDFRPSEQELARSMEKSVYSFNNIIDTGIGKIDQIWAGPSHWKLKFIRRSRSVYSGQDRNEQKEQDKQKAKPRKRKNEVEPLDFESNHPLDIDAMPKKPHKKKNFVIDAEKITVPALEASCIEMLESLEYLLTIPTMKPKKKKTLAAGLDYCVPDYNFNNPNDRDYCSQQLAIVDNDVDMDDDHADNMADYSNTQPEANEAYTGENLVNAPEMVQQTYMNYATRAKKMDMKKLKLALWLVLTQKEEFDASAPVISIMSSQLYKQVLMVLPEKMKIELSYPITFVGLLHLCNEQNLALQMLEDRSDFRIDGPSS